VRAALGLILALVAGESAAQSVDRLPRDAFDVIPPSDRVSGDRGQMAIIQRGCRVGPTTWARRRIVDIATQEWGVFGFQTFDATVTEDRVLPPGVVSDAVNPSLDAPRNMRLNRRFGVWESDRRMDASIAGYWSATPDGEDVVTRQNRQWRDSDGETSWVEPWSAAFISWVMCEAGLGDESQFRRSIAHWVYVDQAIEAADGEAAEAAEAAYVAHEVGEVEVAPGDLICNARATTRYRTLADRRVDLGRQAPLHCDIIVRVDADARTMAVIGGNVVNGVSLTVAPLAAGEGPLRPTGAYFAHLSLRADPVEPLALDGSPTIRALTQR
jgi:hypothetical protein